MMENLQEQRANRYSVRSIRSSLPIWWSSSCVISEASSSLSVAQIEERLIEEELQVAFEYPLMGDVMRIVKEEGATVLAQDFQLSCRLHLSLRRGQMPHMRQRFEDLYGATIIEA